MDEKELLAEMKTIANRLRELSCMETKKDADMTAYEKACEIAHVALTYPEKGMKMILMN